MSGCLAVHGPGGEHAPVVSGHADEGTAEFLFNAAKAAYPGVFDSIEPKKFAKPLSHSEIAVGGALLAPMVPATVAGSALTGFGASLVRMYLRTPGMTQSDGIRPTWDGTAVAKDIWLAGAFCGLLLCLSPVCHMTILS